MITLKLSEDQLLLVSLAVSLASMHVASTLAASAELLECALCGRDAIARTLEQIECQSYLELIDILQNTTNENPPKGGVKQCFMS